MWCSVWNGNFLGQNPMQQLGLAKGTWSLAILLKFIWGQRQNSHTPELIQSHQMAWPKLSKARSVFPSQTIGCEQNDRPCFVTPSSPTKKSFSKMDYITTEKWDDIVVWLLFSQKNKKFVFQIFVL